MTVNQIWQNTDIAEGKESHIDLILNVLQEREYMPLARETGLLFPFTIILWQVYCLFLLLQNIAVWYSKKVWIDSNNMDILDQDKMSNTFAFAFKKAKWWCIFMNILFLKNYSAQLTIHVVELLNRVMFSFIIKSVYAHFHNRWSQKG